MPVIHIPKDANMNHIQHMNEHLDSGKPSFVLIYMDGCGPCSQTRPEWLKLEDMFSHDDDIGIIDVEMHNLNSIHPNELKENVVGFPTMRYIKNGVCEDYEQCDGLKTDRSYDSFIEWIKKKERKMVGGKKLKTRKQKRRIKKRKQTKRGGSFIGKRILKPIRKLVNPSHYSSEPQIDHTIDSNESTFNPKDNKGGKRKSKNIRRKRKPMRKKTYKKRRQF